MYTSIEGQGNSMFQGQASVRCLIRGQGHWLITHQIGQTNVKVGFSERSQFLHVKSSHAERSRSLWGERSRIQHITKQNLPR